MMMAMTVVLVNKDDGDGVVATVLVTMALVTVVEPGRGHWGRRQRRPKPD